MPLQSKRRPAVALMVLVAFLGAESGCSWIFVKKAPPLPIEPVPPVECTTSQAAPIIDVVAASLLAAGILAGGITIVGCGAGHGPPICYEPQATNLLLAMLGAAAVTTVLAFSTAYGFKHAKECERLKSLQAACVAGDQDSCTLLRGRQPGSSDTPGPSPAESWLREAAGLTSARLWPPQKQER